MKLNDLLVLSGLISATAVAQPANDACSNAEQLCPNVVLSGTTTAATADMSTDVITCFSPSATVWYKFTTDADGGTVTIDVSNLVFNTDPSYGQLIEGFFLSATTPCNTTTYNPVSICFGGSSAFSITTSISLDPNTTYFFTLNGSVGGATFPAECSYDIAISGAGVQQSIPTASITAANTVLCYGDTEIVTATITGATDTVNFNWYFNNALLTSSTTQSTYNAGTLSGNGYLKLIFESDFICTVSDTTDSIYFEVTPISADAGPDKFISEGGQVQLDGSGDGTALWVPGATLTSTTSFTPIASPSETTYYFLTVTNGACTATDSMRVYVGEVITVFTSFTPNGDDINDKWIIQNSGQFDNIEIWVYDRSGQEVFHTTNYATQDKWWDGTLKNNGDPLPASTYFYVIDLKEGDYPVYKGPVTIIR